MLPASWFSLKQPKMANQDEEGTVYDIRVLDILPMDVDEGDATPIECQTRSITVTPQGASEDYEAVSYTWTTETHRVHILVSGVEREVTPHLAAAIRRLRRKDEIRTIWVDQLCINQNDTKEKTEQVKVMRHIYSHCTQCIVWWGEIPYADRGIQLSDAEAAFDLLQYMSTSHKAQDQSQADDPKIMPKWLQEAASVESGEDRPLRDLARVKRAMLALECITVGINPWWTRVWTVQEAVLPPRGLYVWGPLELDWDVVSTATGVYNGSRGVWPTLIGELYWTSRRYQRTWSGIMVHQIWLNNSRIPAKPLEVIKKWRRRHATEPRDNIYGLMGLIPSGLPTMQDCDYDLKIPDIYGALTVDLIVNEQGLLPLIMDPRLELGTETPGLPRWAIDMKSPAKYDTDWCPIYAYPSYNADKGLGKQDWAHFKDLAIEDTYQRLTLHGAVLLDVITNPMETFLYIGGIVEEDDIPLDDILRTMVKHYSKVMDSNAQAYPEHDKNNHVTYREAFARLVLGDFIRDGEQEVERPATTEDFDAVYTFIETGEAEWHIRSTVLKVLKSQGFFVTAKHKFLGIGQRELQNGDEIWLFPGGRMPFVLRPKTIATQFSEMAISSNQSNEVEKDFVGRCYIQGIMQGEAVDKQYIQLKDSKTVRLY